MHKFLTNLCAIRGCAGRNFFYALQPTPEEMKNILAALMKDNVDLAGRGYTGQGHFYRCPNGHPYVIGDCGAATQMSVCPDCGARIGGTGHQLTAGNSEDRDMRALAEA